jgi:uncharacterized protein (TIGR02246 family)
MENALRDPDFVRERVDAVRQSYTEFVESGNAAGVAGLYADDAVSMPTTGGRFEGREAIQASYQATFNKGTVAFRAEPRSFETSGDTAVEEGVVHFSITAPNEAAEMIDAEYLVVLKEIDGSWKIYRMMSKLLGPPIP